jgi:hypothetical protein
MRTDLPESTGIFISYRREDTAYPAAWLYDRLTDRFGRGQVFKDVDSIEPGDDFAAQIIDTVGLCTVMLVLIGARWLTATGTNGQRRLDDPADLIRLEIEAAFARNVRVIPILVDGALMPRSAELPVPLGRLANRQALELNPARFSSDVTRLLRLLDSTILRPPDVSKAERSDANLAVTTPARLPKAVAAKLDSVDSWMRIAAVNELASWLTDPDPARVLAATQALRNVADSDIPVVAGIARTHLGAPVGHAFISYVHVDSAQVDRLQRILQAVGVPVWRDTADLWPGEDWRVKIRRAITENALVFIVCFSRAAIARGRSYQNEELALAIEQLRLRRPDDPWLIPVRFDECDIPDRDIGSGRTLTSIQRADLFGDSFDEGASRLVAGRLSFPAGILNFESSCGVCGGWGRTRGQQW